MKCKGAFALLPLSLLHFLQVALAGGSEAPEISPTPTGNEDARISLAGGSEESEITPTPTAIPDCNECAINRDGGVSNWENLWTAQPHDTDALSSSVSAYYLTDLSDTDLAVETTSYVTARYTAVEISYVTARPTTVIPLPDGSEVTVTCCDDYIYTGYSMLFGYDYEATITPSGDEQPYVTTGGGNECRTPSTYLFPTEASYVLTRGADGLLPTAFDPVPSNTCDIYDVEPAVGGPMTKTVVAQLVVAQSGAAVPLAPVSVGIVPANVRIPAAANTGAAPMKHKPDPPPMPQAQVQAPPESDSFEPQSLHKPTPTQHAAGQSNGSPVAVPPPASGIQHPSSSEGAPVAAVQQGGGAVAPSQAISGPPPSSENVGDVKSGQPVTAPPAAGQDGVVGSGQPEQTNPELVSSSGGFYGCRTDGDCYGGLVCSSMRMCRPAKPGGVSPSSDSSPSSSSLLFENTAPGRRLGSHRSAYIASIPPILVAVILVFP